MVRLPESKKKGKTERSFFFTKGVAGDKASEEGDRKKRRDEKIKGNVVL